MSADYRNAYGRKLVNPVNIIMTLEQFEHYKTGIPSFDEEHWLLFCQLDELACVIASEDYDAALLMQGAIFDRIIEHYSEEQRLMEDAGYPYTDFHCANHSFLVNQLRLANKYNVQLLSKYMCVDLVRMLVAHIDHHDLQFTQWLDINHQPI